MRRNPGSVLWIPAAPGLKCPSPSRCDFVFIAIHLGIASQNGHLPAVGEQKPLSSQLPIIRSYANLQVNDSKDNSPFVQRFQAVSAQLGCGWALGIQQTITPDSATRAQWKQPAGRQSFRPGDAVQTKGIDRRAIKYVHRAESKKNEVASVREISSSNAFDEREALPRPSPDIDWWAGHSRGGPRGHVPPY